MLTKLSAPPIQTKRFNFSATIIGTALAIFIAIILILISGTTLYYSPATEKWIPVLGLLIFFASIFSGSFFAAKKAGTKGLYHGLGVGVLFLALTFGVSAFLGSQFLGLAVSKKLVTAVLSGSLGGIWGVGANN